MKMVFVNIIGCYCTYTQSSLLIACFVMTYATLYKIQIRVTVKN
jgi:hypothetical protein